MTSTSFVRRALTAGALASAAAGAVLLPAAPASATPVDGYVDAFGYGRVPVVGCVANLGPVNERRLFAPATGRRTEVDIPTGTTLTKRAGYRVALDYRR